MKYQSVSALVESVANAIRKKKNSTDLINPQDFAEEIENLSSGEDNKDVIFYDYDGTILYAYTKSEFLNMTEMPPLPTKEGLICQGWNWDFENVRECVELHGVGRIGAIYITDDNKTRLYVTIPYDKLNISFIVNGSSNDAVLIDWGDGSDITSVSKSSTSIEHQYFYKGDYCLSVTGGSISNIPSYTYRIELGSTTISSADNTYILKTITIPNDTGSIPTMSASYIEHVNIPKCRYSYTNIPNNAFSNCLNLKNVVFSDVVYKIGSNTIMGTILEKDTVLIIPKTIESLNSTFAQGVCNLKNVLYIDVSGITGYPKRTLSITGSHALEKLKIPHGFTHISSYTQCKNLKSVDLPESTEAIDSFSYCGNLKHINLPDSINVLGEYCFMDTALETVKLPNSLTTISRCCFAGCYNLKSVTIPDSVTTISNRAFSQCNNIFEFVLPKYLEFIDEYGLAPNNSYTIYDFSNCIAVVNITSTTALSLGGYTQKYIIVPDNLYDEWIVATNWVIIANRIIKKSDWDAQQNN